MEMSSEIHAGKCNTVIQLSQTGMSRQPLSSPDSKSQRYYLLGEPIVRTLSLISSHFDGFIGLSSEAPGESRLQQELPANC